jgi:hypothetical protein
LRKKRTKKKTRNNAKTMRWNEVRIESFLSFSGLDPREVTSLHSEIHLKLDNANRIMAHFKICSGVEGWVRIVLCKLG